MVLGIKIILTIASGGHQFHHLLYHKVPYDFTRITQYN